MQHSAQEIGERLKDAVEYNLPRLLAISEEEANLRAGSDPGWSRKQELGHLIDSATNNRVRRSEEHTSELQSQFHLVCRLLLEKKKKKKHTVLTTKKQTK